MEGKNMERISIKSSQIRSIGWSQNPTEPPEGKGTLEVEFTSSAVYDYADVPYLVYRTFLAAESKGKYFATFIRANYEYVCVFKPEKKKEEVKVHGANENLEKDLKKSIKQAKAKKNA
jgi:KTSC domain